MRIVAIVVAAGRGSRAGGEMPKQYRPLGGRPLLARTLDAFLAHPRVDAVLCAIRPADRALYDEAVAPWGKASRKLLPPVYGGDTRQISVCRALEGLAAKGTPEICLVHDAARPFVNGDLIERAIEAGLAYEAAIPGVAPIDTIKRVDANEIVVETVDRASLRATQTPQAFSFKRLLDTHQAAEMTGIDSFTDDGQLAEWAGLSVHVFPGDPANMKVTHPSDFAEAERRLGANMISRVGTGFDVHAFDEGDHIWLGGIRIAHDRGILAHSDGDVALHALTDALLGALSDGDIGTHFPPSDPQWRGASSDRFLAYAVEKVRGRGGRIDHLDVTVLAERPKIGPHRDAIRARIAEIAGLPLDAVSIKATTTEELGFTGRGEGIAAQAAATIRLPERT